MKEENIILLLNKIILIKKNYIYYIYILYIYIIFKLEKIKYKIKNKI